MRPNHRPSGEDFRYKLVIPVLGAPVGTYFALCENTSKMCECDMCGHRRKCDFFECWCLKPITGFDCCRYCRKEVFVEE